MPSPNGSTIVVCGHEGGLLLIWRGGIPLKSSKTEPEKESSPPKANGASDAMIILDSDDEDVPTKPSPQHINEPEFEEGESEFDPSQPYEPIIQTLELPLGTDVLHLTFPQLPPDLHLSSLGSLPKMLLVRMLMAVTCADCSVRVLSLPLTPPSSKSKARPELRKDLLGPMTGNGMFREQMLVLSGGNGHQRIPEGVSVSLSPHIDVGQGDIEMDDPEPEGSTHSRTSSHARHKICSREGKRGDEELWDVLVASHSTDTSGLLLIHRVPLLDDGSGIDLKDFKASVPWRIQSLASPAMSIQFNTSLYPASRHSHLLLTNANGVARIFDCQPDLDAKRGSWLISLYTNYESTSNGLPRRKDILKAQWVLGGKAIAVLLADGEWGIWDLEAAGPKDKKDTDSWQAPAGVNLSKFAISGRVGSSSTARESAKSSATTESRSRLAPMTPGTRKVRQETLFTGPAAKSVRPARGGISLLPIPDGLDHRADDETLLLWYGNSTSILPSLLTHWQTKVQGSGNLFGKGARGQAKDLNNIQLGGELRNDVSLIPQRQTSDSAASDPRQSNVLITGEHRFIIVAPPRTEPEASAAPKPGIRSEVADQALLAKGELDVNGIDNMLDSMTNGHQTNGIPKHGLLSI